MIVMIMADTNIFTNWNILWSKSKKVNISINAHHIHDTKHEHVIWTNGEGATT